MSFPSKGAPLGDFIKKQCPLCNSPGRAFFSKRMLAECSMGHVYVYDIEDRYKFLIPLSQDQLNKAKVALWADRIMERVRDEG